MIARDRNADGNTTTGTGGLEQRVYAIQDANWNTTAIIAATGVPGVAAGNVINRFAYTPYGESQTLTASWATPPAGSTPAVPWSHLFQGLEFTDVTGLAYVRHRDYSASLGRFIELDPIGFDAGDNNWYRFVGNGPTGKTDPFGLEENAPGIPGVWWFDPQISTAVFVSHYSFGRGSHLTIPSGDVKQLLNDKYIKRTVNNDSVLKGIARDAATRKQIGQDCGTQTKVFASGAFDIAAATYSGDVGNTPLSIATDDFHVYGNTTIKVAYTGTVEIKSCCPGGFISFFGSINYIVSDRFANPTDIKDPYYEGPDSDPYGTPYGFSGNYLAKNVTANARLPCGDAATAPGGRRDRRR
jgi:RHS repeat-associated protein